MAWDRNLCLLPSNAPPNEHQSSSRGILKITSGNAQPDILDSSPVDSNVTPSTPLKGTCTEDSLKRSVSPCWQAPIGSTPDGTHSRARTRSNYSYARTHRPQPRQSRWLERRLARSHGLPKLTQSELRSEEYLKYRNRQRKNIDKDGNVVWSDRLEEAFQRAIREYRPVERRKEEMEPGWQKEGSNQWISNYIEIMTGEVRCRKQVSSHIQVLKKFLGKNPEWMSLVTTKERSEDERSYDMRARHIAAEHYQMQQRHQFDAGGPPVHPHIHALPPSSSLLGSNIGIAPQCSVLSVDFKMWVNPPAPDNQRHELHVCTALDHEAQLPPMTLEDMPNWRLTYPDLASISEQGPVDCSLVLMETKLDLMTDYPPTGSRLGINFFARIANGSAYEFWDYTTKFYEKGRCVNACSGDLRFHIEEGETIEAAKLEMPLESSWWVKLFFKMSERRRAREARGDQDALQEVDAKTTRYLNDLTIMQEVWAISYENNLPRRRIAILLWNFRQVCPGEAATTQWKELIPPPPRIATNSPAPIKLGSPMALDATLNDHIRDQVDIYTIPFHHQPYPAFGHCPDPASDSQQSFIDYPTTSDGLSVPSAGMTYPICSMDIPQESLESVDFMGGHINMYCESYAQPAPPHSIPYDSHGPFVAPQANMQEEYNDDEQWEGIYPHTIFTDVGFEPANLPPVIETSELGDDHKGGQGPPMALNEVDIYRGASPLQDVLL